MPDRKIRVLIAKPGLDGHDRGAKVVALALRDAGFEVLYSGLHQTVDQIIATVIEEDVDVIGLSILSGAHLPIAESLCTRLKAVGVEGKLTLVGGNIPAVDIPALKSIGVAEVFASGSRFEDMAAFIREALAGRQPR